MVNILWMRSGRCGATGARGMTSSGIMASLATTKAMAFSNIFGIFCGGEF